MRPNQNNPNLISLSNFVGQIDMANTMGGGIATPRVHAEPKEAGIVLHVNVPSLSEGDYRVEVRDYLLQILTTYDGEHTYNKEYPEKSIENPILLQQIPLAPNISLDGIDAVFKKGVLYVYLPFKADEGNRSIDIRTL